MPPKAKVTREMIINAGFELVREQGIEAVNARTISQKLGCSIQPVMYHFAKMEDLKKAIYAKLNQYHTDYLMNIPRPQKGVMLGIGLNYIRFAIEEPNFFRFLFQSGFASGNSLLEMIDSDELEPVLSAMREALGLSMEQTKEVFLTMGLSHKPTKTPETVPGSS